MFKSEASPEEESKIANENSTQITADEEGVIRCGPNFLSQVFSFDESLRNMTLDDMIFTFMDLPLEPKEVQDHGTVKEELPKNAKKRGKGACQMESLSVSKERLGL